MTRPVVLLSILFATVVSADDWCTFYSDSTCTQQSGGTSYSVENSGCLQNSGGWIKCSGDSPFKLVQSPSNDGGCGCQSNCIQFAPDGSSRDPYETCVPINLTPGCTDFRFITGGHNTAGTQCGANNC